MAKFERLDLKTQHGKMLRPIQRIYPLEIRSNENLQRGMEESIPTVSEILSPDENQISRDDDRIGVVDKVLAYGTEGTQMESSFSGNRVMGRGCKIAWPPRSTNLYFG
ncbi:hypothetical protein TNCV_3259521 [Trichonephila clavipes]|nr:hypothetical protein TNCV_3259521 [Trichonephila clavipes]